MILDFTRVLAGPYATAMLADAGAEVIKVESPEGDDYRHIGPFVDGESALFEFVNRGKRSIVLDLKTEEGLETARQLAAKADVVVENFRPGVADKLGIGYADLSAVNPGLVYLSISGFGGAGPSRDRPAYDIIVQAQSGLMSITGDPDGPPTLIGESIGDVTAGLYGAWAVSTALCQRGRSGQGCHIDLAMFDSLLSIMPIAACRYLATGAVPQRVGNRHPLSTPFGIYRTADGHAAVAVLNERLFTRLAEVMGAAELAKDPRFATDSLRTSNEPVLRERIEQWSLRHTTATVIEQLSASGIPCSAINSVAEAVDSDQARQRGLFRDSGGTVRVPEQPAHFSGAPRGRSARAPRLGEHSAEIMASLNGRIRGERS